MNKIFYQLSNDEDRVGGDANTFMYLNPIDEETYERLDRDIPPGEGSQYTMEEFEECFVDGIDLNTFKLEFIYD